MTSRPANIGLYGSETSNLEEVNSSSDHLRSTVRPKAQGKSLATRALGEEESADEIRTVHLLAAMWHGPSVGMCCRRSGFCAHRLLSQKPRSNRLID